jgi:glycosyltransferase involved in cell wall biosynthesis
MADALRVLMLSWRDTGHPEAGGAELFLERIAGGLRDRGHQITIQSADYPGARRDEVVDGVRYVRRGGRFTVYPLAALSLLRQRGDHDVVVDVQNGVPFWSPLVTRSQVVNLTHHVHREQWPVIFGPHGARFGWWLESRAAPRVYRRSRYVTVSHATRHDLAGLGVPADAIAVVHNGHDGPAGPEPVAPRSARPMMVVLGRLVPHKRVELAIEALAALRPELPELSLVVIGHGYWQSTLHELAERLGVASSVLFTGHVDDAYKHELLAEAWVHVMPSLKEGWGLAVVEAAAHGTPTVAFAAAGGTLESVSDGVTGVLVEDRAELVAAVRRLLVDAELREEYGRAAQKHAAGFTWAHAVAAFEAELYAAMGQPVPALVPAPRTEALPLVVVDEGLPDRRDVGV